MYQKNRPRVTLTQSPRSLWSRRRVIAGAGLTLTGLVLPRAAVAQQQTSADGFQVIRARAGTAALRGPSDKTSPIWGFDGVIPGPLLRVRRGEALRVRVANELTEPITVHWHGLRVPNAMDGVPYLTQQPIAPGASFDYRFTPPDAGTFWYHSRLAPAAASRRSLYGVLIVDEIQRLEVDRDVILLLDEWRLNPDATAAEAPGPPSETRHPTINGGPSFDIPLRANERARLRLVNASLRPLTLRLERHRVMVMAIDGQPAQPYYARDSRILLGPGNRMDLFVDAGLEPGASSSIVLEGERETALARLVYEAGSPARPAPLPEAMPLPPNPLPERMDFQRSFKLDIQIDGKSVDLQAMAKARPLFPVKRGRTVMLGLVNRTASAQVLHLHGHHFRLLDSLDDGWKPFWLDTLPIPASQTARIAFVADNPGKWLIRSHRIEEQDVSMAGWFEVTS
jgi:FtsP/CotA-like multicopper oxidase with cupredoxin domain